LARGWECLRLAGSVARRQKGMRAWRLARAAGAFGERHACCGALAMGHRTAQWRHPA